MTLILLCGLFFASTLSLLATVIYLLRDKSAFRKIVQLQSENSTLAHKLNTLLDMKPVQDLDVTKLEFRLEETKQLYEIALANLAETQFRLKRAEVQLERATAYEEMAIRSDTNLKSALEEIKYLNVELSNYRNAVATISLLMNKATRYERWIYNGFFITDVTLFTEVRDHLLPQIVDERAEYPKAS